MNNLRRGLIVSCQALEEEPLYGSGIMSKMALAAKVGGAVGFRANGVDDIGDIKKVCDLPVIGIIKKAYPGYEVYITPSMKEINELIKVNPDIIALDATMRPRPEFDSPEKFIKAIKEKFNVRIMADISNYEEGLNAYYAGVDLIATTLSGYTNYTLNREKPDIELIRKLSSNINVPIIAEGHVDTPEQASECLKAGAYAVVVGSAITRPHLITKRFVDQINEVIA